MTEEAGLSPNLFEELDRTCTTISSQMANISLPVKLKPYAKPGDVMTECCGEPEVSVRQIIGPNCGCELVITQTICMHIPVEYGSALEVGETTVTCKRTGCLPGCK